MSSPSRHVTTEQLWQYSLSVYSNTDVAARCLNWQDTYNANVNLILACCWLEQKGTICSPSIIAEWHRKLTNLSAQTTNVYRQTRKQLKQRALNLEPPNKTPLDDMRPALLKTELQFEKNEQQRLVYLINLLSQITIQTSDKLNYADWLTSYGTHLSIPSVEIRTLNNLLSKI